RRSAHMAGGMKYHIDSLDGFAGLRSIRQIVVRRKGSGDVRVSPVTQVFDKVLAQKTGSSGHQYVLFFKISH
ncbi:MAG: hypothetical protein AAB932_01280, partial [Patescibacteria group bacterium]